MTPTPQQSAFRDAVLSGTSNIRLDSGAGTGKTSTLVYTVNDLPQTSSVFNVAFNKRIADTLDKRLPGRTNRTFNSIGHRAFAAALGKRLTLNKDKMSELALEVEARGYDWVQEGGDALPAVGR